MDNETEKKLTELQHQHELLRTDMEANVRTMKADNETALAKNESAVDRLIASNEKAIAELRASIFIQMVGVVAAGVAVLGGFIAVLQFLK